MPSFREIIGYIGIPFVYIANGIRWVFNTIATGLGFNMGRVDPGLPDDDHSRDGSANPEEDAERGFDALPNIRSEPTVVVPQAWPPPLEAVAKETLPVLRKNPLLSTSRPLITEGVADGSLRVEASTTPRTSISSDMPVPVSAITEAQRPSSQLFS